MDKLKKIIHPHQTEHHASDSTTTTDQHHSSKLPDSQTGDNLANPFSAPNARVAEGFRQEHTGHGVTAGSAGTTSTGQYHTPAAAGGSNLTSGADRGTAHAYGAGVGAPVEGAHQQHHHEGMHGTGAGVGGGVGGGGAEGVGSKSSDSYVPGVNTGGAKVVEARMPVEEGNNFPGTNPNHGHDALGTADTGGLKYAGGGGE